MTNKLLEETNGGFPPISINKIINNNLKKERGYMSEYKNVKINDIIKTKKSSFLKQKEKPIEIVDSL